MTKIEFIDTPLHDVLEYLADRHDIELFSFVEEAMPITMDFSNIPLYLALSVSRREWTCQLLAIMSCLEMSKPSREFGKHVAAREERIDGLGDIDGKAFAALAMRTKSEFIEAPLSDLLSYYEDLHETLICLGREDFCDVPISLHAHRPTLAWTLDLISFEQDST